MDEKARRKEMRRQSEEAAEGAGVFSILNTVNDKIYLDKTPNLRARLNRFKIEFRTGGVRQPTALVEDLKQYGADAFEFEVRETLDPPKTPDYDPTEDLVALLELWLEKLEPWGERGYNKAP